MGWTVYKKRDLLDKSKIMSSPVLHNADNNLVTKAQNIINKIWTAYPPINKSLSVLIKLPLCYLRNKYAVNSHAHVRRHTQA